MTSVFEEMPLDQMLARVKKYNPGDGYKIVEKAYHFAEKAHEGVKRKSGEPYFSHPVFVASILTELMIDPPTIAAGLLHDTLEDVDWVTRDVLRAEFGDEITELVDGVTKLNRLDFANREQAQAESLRKMILAMSKDIRVVLIKLADRLHNMRTLRYQAPERQVPIAIETRDIYAPLAHRLGVYTIKTELEDLALRYIDPEGYQMLVQKVGMKRAEREASIRMVISALSEKLDENHIHFDIDGRPKHFYSIYKKMKLQNKPFEQIYDLIAIRVIVDTVQDCYAVLGIVHTLWPQMPGRFKDYISLPKGNMYQSLHTTVIGRQDSVAFPFEVQIRTWEMHRVAEYGIAAHWRYKEGGGSPTDLDNKLYWVRQILDWQSDTRDSKEFVDTLKVDLFAEEVFMFTPKGDVKSMPKGATALDFAYAIHSEVGNHCVGAKVNGRIVPLDTVLQTGDWVEILTSAGSKGPSTDWLRICKTPQARSKIRACLKKQLREENIVMGRNMVEHESKRRGANLSELLVPEYYEGLLRKYGFQELEDVFGAVGYGSMSSSYVVSRLMEEQRAREPQVPRVENTRPQGHISNGIYLEGNEDMDIPVRFAKCCSPVPGDEIVGYITRGRGVTIHKAECKNAQCGDKERQVKVAWANTETGTFCVSIKVLATDHVGLLGEVTMFIASLGVPIRNSSSGTDKNQLATIRLVLEVKSREQMDSVIRQLQYRNDVLEVIRTTG